MKVHLKGEVVALEVQVKHFAVARASLVETLGTSQTATFLSKALFIISVGANDLLEFSTNKSAITLGPQQYLAALQSNYYTQILNLYALGARRFGIVSVAAIGCYPAVRPTNYGGECVEEVNQLAIGLNSATFSTLEKLRYDLRDFKYSFGNSFAMSSAVLKGPAKF